MPTILVEFALPVNKIIWIWIWNTVLKLRSFHKQKVFIPPPLCSVLLTHIEVQAPMLLLLFFFFYCSLFTKLNYSSIICLRKFFFNLFYQALSFVSFFNFFTFSCSLSFNSVFTIFCSVFTILYLLSLSSVFTILYLPSFSSAFTILYL